MPDRIFKCKEDLIMIIKRKQFSVINGVFNVMSAKGISNSKKERQAAEEQHDATMMTMKKENKQLVDQLNNIAKS